MSATARLYENDSGARVYTHTPDENTAPLFFSEISADMAALITTPLANSFFAYTLAGDMFEIDSFEQLDTQDLRPSAYQYAISSHPVWVPFRGARSSGGRQATLYLVKRGHTFGVEIAASETRDEETISKVLDLIAQSVPYGAALAERLRDLAEAAQEEAGQGTEQLSLSASSLTNFKEFLVSEEGLAKPSTVLTWDGHIRAEWRKDADHRVAAEFMGDGTVRLVIFAPSRTDTNTICRFSRQVPVASLTKTVEPYAVPLRTSAS